MISHMTSALATGIVLFSLCAASPVIAQPETPILSLPQGQVILNISATERREVTEDLLVATLTCSSDNIDPQALQNTINTTMQKAIDLAAKVPAVHTATGSYSVYATTDSRTKERKWQGRQSLTLKSKDAQALLELAGKLQGRNLTMSGLSYTVDPQTAADVQDSLMESALKRLQARADRAARALGKSKAELREISVQGTDSPFPVTPRTDYMVMAKSAREMAAPVAKAGETTITLTVSGKALLKE